MKSFPKRLRRILTYVFLVLFFAILLTSCSDRNHAKRLVRQAYAKIKKAEELDPSSVDSIKNKRNIEIDVPEEKGTLEGSVAIDSSEFDKTLNMYDSLKNLIDQLKRNSKFDSMDLAVYNNSVIDLETKNTKLSSKQIAIEKANAELKAIKNRLISGFVKDSVYNFEDSLVAFKIPFRSGLIGKPEYTIKPKKVSKEIDTTSINLKSSPAVLGQTWFWIMLCIIILLFLIIIVRK